MESWPKSLKFRRTFFYTPGAAVLGHRWLFGRRDRKFNVRALHFYTFGAIDQARAWPANYQTQRKGMKKRKGEEEVGLVKWQKKRCCRTEWGRRDEKKKKEKREN
ncbi:unnamed protein product [Cuscuta epithymum]|uniref:Uncharacterized protein n=1 Tax=Cuscuta epithymum TaxID=186058 RepID=A0AAV0EBW6_9ASTE|nr:unnamed protein product [Cuscuta epithymum]